MANNSNMIPIPGRLHSVATDGQVAGANEIHDDAQNKKQSTINSELINAVGSGGSVDSRIADAKAEIIGDAATDYNTLGKLEDKIQVEASRAEGAESALDGRVDTLEDAVGTGGSVDSRISAAVATETTRAQGAESNLQELYEGLTQSNIEVVDTLPATGEAYKIYRLIGTNSYADYMYNSSDLITPIKMAEYDNAIDDEPTAGSENLVKSGGIADMYGSYTENSEYVYVQTDNEDKILEGIKTDGTKVIGGDLQVNGNIINDGIQEYSKKLSSFESAENPEWIQITTDAEGKILEGITSEGKKKVMVETEYPNDNVKVNNLSSNNISTSILNIDNYINLSESAQRKLQEDVINTDYSSIPSYYVEHLNNAVSRIKENMGIVGKNGESFIFISDIHWDGNTKNSPRLIKEILNRLNIKDVLSTGDLINWGQKDDMSEALIECVKKFSFNGHPFITARGNHDDNTIMSSSHDEFTFNEYYSYFLKQMEGVVTFIDGATFYYDKPETKTRYIFVDSGDVGDLVNSDTVAPKIANILLETEDEWKVIFIQHFPSGSSLGFIKEIVDGCNSRSSSSTYAFIGNFDFSTAKCKCIAIFLGHAHKDDSTSTHGGIPIIIIDTDCGARTEQTTYPFVAGTVTEQCFDVVTMDYVNRTIKCVRVGRGIDREFNY